MTPQRGSLLIVDLDPTRGREQSQRRPCIVVSAASIIAAQRYPVIVVLPVTGTLGLGDLYPVVQPFARGLAKPSIVLVDQIRAIDKVGVSGQMAPLPAADMQRVDEAPS